MTESEPPTDLSSPALPYTFIAERAMFIITSIFVGLLLLGGLWATAISVSAWPLLAIFVGIAVYVHLAISALRVTVTGTGITFRWLNGAWTAPFADITRIALLPGRYTVGPSRKMVNRCILLELRGSNEPLCPPYKPFSKEDLAVLVDAIATHAPHLVLDEYLQALRTRNTAPIEHASVRAVVGDHVRGTLVKLALLLLFILAAWVISLLRH
ncbi:MAG: hypothetical protein BWY76_00369 [bacterium ADurb.Bin429]|nr:MAG: hypothetical protein BWY76_00369 [bacterium ADurb.Bin429]